MQSPPIFYRLLFVIGLVTLFGGFAVGIYQSVTSDEGLPPIALDYVGPIKELVDSSDFEAAAEQARIVLELDGYSQNGRAMRKILAQALTEGGDAVAAIPEYQRAIRRRPDDAGAHFGLGLALVEEGRLEEAAASYAQAAELDPTHAAAHNNLGTTLCQLGRMDEGMGHMREAFRIKPDYAEPHFNLASALAGMGRLEEAESQLREALRIRPDYAKAQAALRQVEATLEGSGG